MPAVVRVGDNHSCGSVDIAGSPDTFVNGKNVHRVGDADAHGGIQVEGSPDFFVNGKSVARIGDDHSGDSFPHPPNPEATGSPDTFIDDIGTVITI